MALGGEGGQPGIIALLTAASKRPAKTAAVTRVMRVGGWQWRTAAPFLELFKPQQPPQLRPSS